MTAIAIVVLPSITTFATDEKKMITDLLTQRANILEQALFDHISDEIATARLAEIETGEILAEDIASLKDFIDTDMDMVEDIFLIALESKDINENKKSFRIELLWDMRGLEDNYFEKAIYTITLSNENSKPKLEKMTLVE